MIHTPRSEALRYLGYRGAQPDEATAALLDERIQAVEGAADPRWTAVEVPLTLRPGGVELGDWSIDSEKLRSHLDGCTAALLFGATLGVGVDRLIARSAAGQVARAALDQAVAAALIEAVCDHACDQLAQRYPGKYLRPRFSPGYGDFPIAFQRPLLEALEASKRIGLTATETMMLTPTKSVTAVVGLSPTPWCPPTGCAACGKADCAFRKG